MGIKAKDFLNEINKGPSTFGHLLSSLRAADEVSQTALARKLGVSRGLICDIEKGRRTISIVLALKIAKVMGYSEKVILKRVLEDQLKSAKAHFKIKIEAA